MTRALPVDSHARSIAERVLGEVTPSRRHIVVVLSGAHAYGFPSPDSDLDLKAIHAAPTTSFIGLGAPATHADRQEVIEGVEIDYSSNELQGALAGILAGNGNYVERVLGKLVLLTTPEHASLAPIVKRALSRKLHRHYRGFATSQRNAAAAPGSAVKSFLYVLRTALTGAHVLRTGEIETDVTRLFAPYGFEDALELVAIKRTGERAPLADTARARWLTELDRAFVVLDAAEKDSCLPAEPPNAEELEAWLIALRRATF